MTAGNMRFDLASFWVQIWGALFDMVTPSIVEAVGGCFGVVEEVENRQKQDIPNFFMRVKVALPLSKPFRRGAFLAGLNGQRTWVTFKYERLSLFCHYYELLGHDPKHCAQYFMATKNGEEVECQYGEWMKATGTRARSPSSKGRYRGEANHGTEERTVHSQQGSGRVTEADDGGSGEVFTRVCTNTHVIGTTRNYGIFLEDTLPNHEFHGEKSILGKRGSQGMQQDVFDRGEE